MTTHTLSLGPLSLLATQTGPLLSVTIHAPSDTAPVGKMTLTVPEWTALVALVDCMGVAEKRHAEDKAEIERLNTSVDRYQDAAWAGIEESNDNIECCAVGCSIGCASMNARASGWTINRNGLPFCSEHADRAFNPTETKSDRDSLRQQVRELTEERDKARRDVAANRALSMLAPKEMSYDDRSEFDRLKHSDVAQGKRIADLIAERDRLRSDLSAALVSVDAMAKRLEQLQPIVSVLGDWDWAAIGADVDEVGTAHLIDDRALMAVIKALAHTAGEQAKEGGRG